MSIPEEAVVYKDVSALIDELGVDVATTKILRKRLEHKYKLTFSAEDNAMLKEVITKKFEEPAFQRDLVEAMKRSEQGAVQAGSKVRKPRTRRSEGKSEELAPVVASTAPTGPKKPLSVYFLYSADARAKLKAENPGLRITEIASRTAEMWRAIGDEEKAHYTAKAEEEKKRYEVELEAFKQAGGVVPKRGATKKEGKKGKPQMAEEDVDNDRPPPPKRPMAAFFMYLADVRQQVKQDNPQFGVPELSKAVGEMWKNASEEVKAKYAARETQVKAEYARQMEEYTRQYGTVTSKKRSSRTSRPTVKKVAAKKQEKSASSSSSDTSSSDSESSASSSDGSSDSSNSKSSGGYSSDESSYSDSSSA